MAWNAHNRDTLGLLNAIYICTLQWRSKHTRRERPGFASCLTVLVLLTSLLHDAHASNVALPHQAMSPHGHTLTVCQLGRLVSSQMPAVTVVAALPIHGVPSQCRAQDAVSPAMSRTLINNAFMMGTSGWFAAMHWGGSLVLYYS